MKLVRFLMKLTGKTVTVTLKNGSDIQGSVFRVDTSMTIHLKSAKITRKDSDPMTLDFTTIRGSYIRYIILPEDLVLDALLIDDTPKAKPKRERTGANSTRPRGRGRGRGRGGRGRSGGNRGRQ